MATNKYTQEQIIQAIIDSKGMVYIAARRLGCEPKTIYNYAKRYKSIQDEINNQRGLMGDVAEMALYTAITEKQPWAVQFYLKTQAKDRGYVERQEVSNFNIEVSNLTDEQLERIANGEDPLQVARTTKSGG